jgi:ribonuclease HII
MALLPFYTNHLEAGLDEAGRGCLAGPVVAAAVILPEGFFHPLLNDSKKLSEKSRLILRPIIEKEALAWAVHFHSPEKIDEINILKASISAMQEAVKKLKLKPAHLLVDGNRFYEMEGYTHSCMIKGDGRFANIAAASVLAKTHRDDYMDIIDKDFKMYGWNKNKGYPTRSHREAIEKHGSCLHHRLSFALLPKQLKLDGLD